MGLPRAAASFPYRCMSCLQAKPAIEMALYDQDRVSGTNTMRPSKMKIFLPLVAKADTEQQIAF